MPKLNKIQALRALENMTNEEFEIFFQTLPASTQSSIKDGSVRWQDVCPEFYIKQQAEV